MYKSIIRPVLFMFNPELIHSFTFSTLKALNFIPGVRHLTAKLCSVNDKNLEQNLFGIHFENPIGLAAGLDKNSEVFDFLGAFGFSFIEVGTVTPLAQPGNQKPRLFRLRKNKALINRMGFNNNGVEFTIRKLKKRKTKIILVGNIGKNKITPNEQATSDYEKCLLALHPYVDLFTINVSSPNTPNLRELQEKEPLKKILAHIKNLSLNLEKPKPVLLKIAPDLTTNQLDDIIEIVTETKIDGIIATNTTIDRGNLNYSEKEILNFGSGGLSGAPIKQKSTEVIKYISTKTGGKVPIIGVGGIFSVEDAIEKLEAGASLLQLYTGFIYEGPFVVRKINKGLSAFCKKNNRKITEL